MMKRQLRTRLFSRLLHSGSETCVPQVWQPSRQKISYNDHHNARRAMC
jgi:hypothetical protein